MTMTVEEFDQQKASLTCRKCGRAELAIKHVTTNNSMRVVCACGEQCPLDGGMMVNLKQSNKKTRTGDPFGKSLEEVWADGGNVCVVCSSPKDFLDHVGITRERHHVLPYAAHGHQGPLVPICGHCHHMATARQRVMAFMKKKLAERHDGQSVSGSSTALPRDGAASDSLSAAPENPARQLEGFSGRATRH